MRDKLERYKDGVLDAALELHMGVSGSGDLSAERAMELSRYLEERLNSWHKSHEYWEQFDHAVRGVILAAIAERERQVTERELGKARAALEQKL